VEDMVEKCEQQRNRRSWSYIKKVFGSEQQALRKKRKAGRRSSSRWHRSTWKADPEQNAPLQPFKGLQAGKRSVLFQPGGKRNKEEATKWDRDSSTEPVKGSSPTSHRLDIGQPKIEAVAQSMRQKKAVRHDHLRQLRHFK
jgi:hypothetical protein